MRMKKPLMLTVVVMIIAAMTAGTMCSYAETNQQKLNSINQQISAAQSRLSQSKAQVSSLSSQIGVLDGQIHTTQSNINQTQAEINTTQADIDQKKADLEVKTGEIIKQNDDLNSRLSAMYKAGDIGYLEVLLGSKSFGDLVTNLDMISRIYKQDEELMAQLQQQYDAIAQTKHELEDLEAQLEAEKAQLESEKASLQASRSQAQALRSQAQHDVNAQNQLIDDLNQSAASITALIRAEQAAAEAARKKAAEEAAAKAAAQAQAQASSQKATSTSSSVKTASAAPAAVPVVSSTPVIKGSGRFCLPAPSYVRISSPFGYRIHPITGNRKLHTGIDYAAPMGSSCVASGSGTVIFAGWYGGYGNAVIIDHGGGISTLYGHNSSILVSKGQSVSKGQQIARIGSTGNSTGPHCHFEVRVNGTPVNPSGYL